MEPTNPQLYFDLGGNPWTSKQKKAFNLLYVLLLLAIPVSIFGKYNTYHKLLDVFPFLLYLSLSILTAYNFSRGRIAPPGYYFVDLNDGTLKFKSFGDEKVESFALDALEYMYKEGRKIAIKPFNNNWHYIQAGPKVDAVFAQLQNLVKDLEHKPQIVNPNKK